MRALTFATGVDSLRLGAVLAHYFKQLDEYRRRTGAKRALLVLVTPGKVLQAR